MPSIDEQISAGEIGGRTVIISEDGELRCEHFEPPPLPERAVRVRTVRSAVSSGTEMTFVGRDASNPYLHKRWNPGLRLFEPGAPSLDNPITFGYRAAGEVIESHAREIPIGARIYGRWRHTELVALTVEEAARQLLPTELSWDDGVDIGQMAPICLNAVAFGGGDEAGNPAIVFGAGVIGLITAQLLVANGANPVMMVDRLAERLELASTVGCETLASDPDTDVAATLKRRFGTDGIPVVWECSGSYAALSDAIRSVRRRGTVVAVGFYQGSSNALRLGDEFHHNGVRLVAAQIGNIYPGSDRPSLEARAIDLVREGRLVLGDLPRLEMPVERAADAFAALKRPADVLQVALTYG
jgi:NADPH:quinone reductase-like Zn-dependent oxidoreductase